VPESAQPANASAATTATVSTRIPVMCSPPSVARRAAAWRPGPEAATGRSAPDTLRRTAAATLPGGRGAGFPSGQHRGPARSQTERS
jgi:hypothetical protein